MNFKILHVGDSHFDHDPVRLERAQISARFIELEAQRGEYDLIIMSGDLMHRRQYLSSASAVPSMIAHVIELAQWAPVVMVYGNAEHDAPGSLDFLMQLNTIESVYVASTAETVLLTEHGAICNYSERLAQSALVRAMIHLFPYPTKAHFLAGKTPGTIDETNAEIETAIRGIFHGMAAKGEDTVAPTVFVGHMNVAGAMLSSGQTLLGQDIMIALQDLLTVNADYYALGHIHKHQAFTPTVMYAGSTYHVNYGEAEEKCVIRVEIAPEGAVTATPVIIPSRPLSLHEMRYDGARFVDQGERDWDGADLRVRVYLTAEQDMPDEFVASYYEGAASIQVERITIPTERTERSDITRALTLSQKLAEYSRATGREVDAETLAIADEIEKEHTL